MNDAHNFDWSSGNGQFPADLNLVWDAVCVAHPLLIEHVTGTGNHPAIGLEQVVRAFHAATVATASSVRPDMLVAMFANYPDGAFASRAHNGPDLLINDVAAIWQKCVEDARAAWEEAAEQASWLTISDEPWDPDTLPPRPWLAPPYLMRNEITLLHGPGAAGKSLLIIVWAVALALGRVFGRLQPHGRSRVLLTNFEDNAIEQMRRISAALKGFGATPADLKGWLYRVSLGPKGDATMFELDEHGQVRTTPCWEALERACETIRPDAVFADPLVAINAVPESDNQLMRRVMTIMRIGMAQRFNCAFIPAHHDNKAASDDDSSDQTNSRGAGDIVNAARFELAVKKMTSQQAAGWGIDASKRGLFFRVGSVASKRNYAAPEESEWFERLEMPVARQATVFCVPWPPPSARLDDDQTVKLVAAIEKGTPRGPYSTQLTNTDRSLALVLEELGITKPATQRRVLARLIDTGHVSKAKWRPPGFGENKTLSGLRAQSGLPRDVAWVEEEEP